MCKMDRRRNTGPELSVRPVYSNIAAEVPVLNQDYIRGDGRYPEQMRPFSKLQTLFNIQGAILVTLN